jgi:hypothetical protein
LLGTWPDFAAESGITYPARDPILNRDIAIKEFLPVSRAAREELGN